MSPLTHELNSRRKTNERREKKDNNDEMKYAQCTEPQLKLLTNHIYTAIVELSSWNPSPKDVNFARNTVQMEDS